MYAANVTALSSLALDLATGNAAAVAAAIFSLIPPGVFKAWAIINQTTHPGYTELLEVKTAKDGKNSRTRTNRSEILDLSFPKKTSPNFPRAN